MTEAPYIVAQFDYGGENANFGHATAGYPFTQTFTPTRGGTLYSLSGGFWAPQSGMQPYYIFQFRDTTAGGLPSTTALASLIVPTSPLTASAYAWIDLTGDFSSFGIPLVAGHKYAFSIDVPGPFGSTTQNNFLWGMTGSGYVGGDAYYIPPTGPVLLDSAEDFLFTVQAVPEPSALGLASLCVWLLGGRVHRRTIHERRLWPAISANWGHWGCLLFSEIEIHSAIPASARRTAGRKSLKRDHGL